MTRQKTIDRGDSITRTADSEDDIASELFTSAREAGVACFPWPEMENETDG